MKKQKIVQQKIRITSGKLKGRRIECPPGETRPMTARVKEALFNILGSVHNFSILDCFAGSGSISIEAFSRGAASSDLVEGDHKNKSILTENLKKVEFHDAQVYITDVFVFLKNCNKKYDFIMLDPPYKMPEKEKLIEMIAEKDLLADNGIMVMQLPTKYKMDTQFQQYYMYDSRHYGLNKIIFFKKQQI
ncbi:MAG: 16S rRNA (guanine(966)-N(2))-methyltransferase RsmD [Spirochaetes bacterium]|nr:16S rRNA (guanine(966)-N(2))-methyltransferase RsmD [Spirochaetota bacterium]